MLQSLTDECFHQGIKAREILHASMEKIIQEKMEQQHQEEHQKQHQDAFDYMLSTAKEQDQQISIQELKVGLEERTHTNTHTTNSFEASRFCTFLNYAHSVCVCVCPPLSRRQQ